MGHGTLTMDVGVLIDAVRLWRWITPMLSDRSEIVLRKHNQEQGCGCECLGALSSLDLVFGIALDPLQKLLPREVSPSIHHPSLVGIRGAEKGSAAAPC